MVNGTALLVCISFKREKEETGKGARGGASPAASNKASAAALAPSALRATDGVDAFEDARSSSPLAILRAPGAQTDGTRHAIVNPDAEDSVESSSESDAESTRTNDPDAASIVSDFGPFTSTDKKYSNYFLVIGFYT